MTSVEHTRSENSTVAVSPSFRWADKIVVEVTSTQIHFRGEKNFARAKDHSERDILAQYLTKISSVRIGDEQDAPHYVFANAKTDAELQRFVERFGPVTVDPESLCIEPLRGKAPGIVIKATQPWENLRRERQIFGYILELYSEAGASGPDLSRIVTAATSLVTCCSFWVQQFDAEAAAEAKIAQLADDPRWIWDASRFRNLSGHVSAVVSAAKLGLETLAVARTHQLICAFLNAFPPTLTRFHGQTIEAVSENVALGTRHLLYFMLRRDYLTGGRIALCKLPGCSRWFRVGYKDTPGCCDDHRLKIRQQKYYDAGGGKEKRAARYVKTKKRAKKARTQK